MKRMVFLSVLLAGVGVLAGCKSPEQRAMDDFNHHMRVMEKMMADMEKSMEAFDRENH